MKFSDCLRGKKGDLVMIAFFVLICVALNFLKLGPAVAAPDEGEKVRGRVTKVDDGLVGRHGPLAVGEQMLEVEILDGSWRGQVFQAHNLLRGQPDLDKFFEVGDIALVAIRHGSEAATTVVNAQEHYRIGNALWLFGLFALCLLLFGGLTGLKALISFIFACQVIWQIVVPLCLEGYNPILICMLAVSILSAAIIFIVAGLNAKGVTAFLGSFLGVLASCLMAIGFTHLFKINGAVMPYAQPLYFSGYEFLNLTDIYIGAIFLASSGAVMDLGMDVAAGMTEVVQHKPDISRRALIGSGFRIGRMVVGTMTTTLLLAYSGGYLTLIMAFAAQGVGLTDFLNYPYVASEVVKTLIGSLGLILVAPFTALAGGVLLKIARPKRTGD